MTEDAGLAPSAGRAMILETFLLTRSGPVNSVLVCDDRPEVHGDLNRMLRKLPGSPAITSVSHGFALVACYATHPADIVLIGVHRGSSSGAEALTMLLKAHPGAVVIVFGAAADIEQLAAVFIRGASGLLLWDPAQPY